MTVCYLQCWKNEEINEIKEKLQVLIFMDP